VKVDYFRTNLLSWFGYIRTLAAMVADDYAAEMLDCAKMKKLRKGCGLNQAQAAERAGLSAGRSQWNDIESGRRANVTLETLGKIAKALGVKAKDLLK
jgi:DNA-binding XRE family transcriptional regulator